MEDLELKNIRTQKEKTFIDSPFEVKLTFITDKNEPEYLSRVQIVLEVKSQKNQKDRGGIYIYFKK